MAISCRHTCTASARRSSRSSRSSSRSRSSSSSSRSRKSRRGRNSRRSSSSSSSWIDEERRRRRGGEEIGSREETGEHGRQRPGKWGKQSRRRRDLHKSLGPFALARVRIGRTAGVETGAAERVAHRSLPGLAPDWMRGWHHRLPASELQPESAIQDKGATIPVFSVD